MGFARYESGKKKEGWLVNVQPTSIEDTRIPGGRAALDCYFIEHDGSTFKATVEYDPYFLIAVKKGHESEVGGMDQEGSRRGRRQDGAKGPEG